MKRVVDELFSVLDASDKVALLGYLKNGGSSVSCSLDSLPQGVVNMVYLSTPKKLFTGILVHKESKLYMLEYDTSKVYNVYDWSNDHDITKVDEVSNIDVLIDMCSESSGIDDEGNPIGGSGGLYKIEVEFSNSNCGVVKMYDYRTNYDKSIISGTYENNNDNKFLFFKQIGLEEISDSGLKEYIFDTPNAIVTNPDSDGRLTTEVYMETYISNNGEYKCLFYVFVDEIRENNKFYGYNQKFITNFQFEYVNYKVYEVGKATPIVEAIMDY